MGDDEEFGFVVNVAGEENGEVLEESESEEEEEQRPPPVPPRNKSLSPEWAMGGSENGVVFGATAGASGGGGIYGDRILAENSTRHFLAQSGGRGRKALPPQPYESEPAPPPLPAKKGKSRRASPPKPPPQDLEDEERALISELNELERLVSQERRTVVGERERGPFEPEAGMENR